MTEPPRRRSFSPLAIVLLILGLIVGFGAEYALTQPTVQQQSDTIKQLQNSVATQSSRINQLNSDKASLQTQLNETSAKLSSANQQLSAEEALLTQALGNLKNNQSQIAKLQAKLSLVGNATQKLNSDRILLGDLRKTVPPAKADAVQFWQGVKTRATNVDPTLGPSVDKILNSIDAYYTNFLYPLANATTYDQVGHILLDATTNGSLAYENNISAFQQDALLVVATNIDQVVTVSA